MLNSPVCRDTTFSYQIPVSRQSAFSIKLLDLSHSERRQVERFVLNGYQRALSLAKPAKKSLEKAIAIDDTVLSGSAYTSLGTLYYKVPGWPIGFGDDDKAKVLLEQALVINPHGIDPNYFMSEYWFEERKYNKAKMFLERAQQAPAQAERSLADKSRHIEIAQLMAKIDGKLKKKH